MLDKNKRTLLLTIFIFFSIIVVFTSINNLWITRDKANEEIPENWVKIENSTFSFIAPNSVKNDNVQGIDSSVWQYSNEELLLTVNAGTYSGEPNRYREYQEFTEQSLIIDGKSAQVVTFRYPDSYDDLIDKEKRFVIFAYFSNVKLWDWRKITFSIHTKSSENKEIALKIVKSIKFN